MMPEDLRTILMFDWLENDLLLNVTHCEPASSDASFRRYFRVLTSKQQFIVMDAPPTKENIEPFIRITKLLAQSQINVPSIFQQNLTNGFLLLEDFGSQCFLDRLDASTADDLYQSAFDSLFKLQTRTSIQNAGLPSYDEPLLHRELAIFEEWFLGQLLDIQIPATVWETVRAILIASALEQPSTCVHRDYHSRNLMVLDSDSPGVIDFQDAVIGPITYDLVSLLRDCYIAWPEPRVERWRQGYFERLQQAGLINCSPAQFKRWFDLMGLQRHLKAIGIFSRLHLRDSKSVYLDDIPRTLNYVTTVCAAYPELAEFNDFLHDHVLPALRLRSAQALNFGYAQHRHFDYAQPRHFGYAQHRHFGYAQHRHFGYAQHRHFGYAQHRYLTSPITCTERSRSMKAMILAAGRGERMRPLTDRTPKPLLLADGRPLIEYTIKQLVEAGFNDIVINHAHLGQQIEDRLNSGHQFGANISYSPEGEQALETAGGIINALHLLGDEVFLVVNGDIATDFPFAELKNLTVDLAHLVLVDNPAHNTGGDFGLDKNGLLVSDSTEKLTFSGIGLYRPELFSNRPVGPSKLGPLLRLAMADGRVSGQKMTGFWMDIGTPERLKELDFYYSQQR
jgi:aminoglycoside/choline kinase family phosphotransferase